MEACHRQRKNLRSNWGLPGLVDRVHLNISSIHLLSKNNTDLQFYSLDAGAEKWSVANPAKSGGADTQ